MKRWLAMLLVLLLCIPPALAEGDAAGADYARAGADDPVAVPGGAYAFEAALFTMAYENWDLVTHTTRDPIPANGEVYLLRLIATGSDGLTHGEFEAEVAPQLRLRAASSGGEYAFTGVTTRLGPDSDALQNAFDVLFYSPEFYHLDELELLCGGVLYPLSGLPGEGEPLPIPPVPAEDIQRLNALHQMVRSNSGADAGDALCTGNVVVAVYHSRDDKEPDVLTALSDHYRYSDFPMEYRADSLATADWAAIIYPTYKNVGYYTGGGPADQTTTWLSLIDLATERQYDLKAATEAPPPVLMNDSGNGASGAFRPEEAVEKLKELIQGASDAAPVEGSTAGEPSVVEVPEPETAGEPSVVEAPEPEATGEPSVVEVPEPEAAGESVAAEEPEPEAAGASVAAEEPATVPAALADVDSVLAALGSDHCRATYEALLAGEVVQNGSKGEAARGVQQTLIDFGQGITADGSVGPKTLAALNAVQSAFGLEPTDFVDAAQYEALLPRLLIATDEPAARELLAASMGGEYDYTRACALQARGLWYSARVAFEGSRFGDWEARAQACVQPWPKTGELYRNPDVKGSNTRLTVQFNSDGETAMLVKLYTPDGVLARTMFIAGTGKATTSLPAGRYIIKDGAGVNWYGEEEAFGGEGYYEVMTFGDGEQEVELPKNYASTITVNVEEYNPDADSVGTLGEDWESF